MEASFKIHPTQEELKAKNQIYNDAASEIWQTTVYDAVHDGWAFTNIGGRTILNKIGQMANLNSSKHVLELCCGLGATCQYLALKHNCPVTGIDLNEFQIKKAQEDFFDPNAKYPIEFILGDIVSWQPRDFYDVVFVMDSLTLIENPKHILNKSTQHLKPGGLFALAEVTSGPTITDNVRQLCWEEDGFINLISAEQYYELLAETGLVEIEIEDRTDLAIDCFTKIYKSVLEGKHDITSRSGELAYEGWLRINEFYVNNFITNQLKYTYATAWLR